MSNHSLMDYLKRSRRTLILLGVAGLFLIVAGLVLPGGRQPGALLPAINGQVAAEKSNAPTPGVPALRLVKPQRRDMVHRLALRADLFPWYKTTLYANTGGYLKWIGFDKGDAVAKGQLLAVLDNQDVEDQYKRAETEYAIKKVTYERLLGLWRGNPSMIAEQEVDEAKAEAESAKYLRDSRRKLLDYAKVSAPFDGVLTARFADPGTFIHAAAESPARSTPLFEIMDMARIRVYAGVPQEAALLAKPGVPATVVVAELPGQEFKGSITRTTEALDHETRMLTVEIDLPNGDRRLKPGMLGTVMLDFGQRQKLLAVPVAAVVSGQAGGEKAIAIADRGRTRLVPVKTGISDGAWVEIVEGLAGNEDIVLEGHDGLVMEPAANTTGPDLSATVLAR